MECRKEISRKRRHLSEIQICKSRCEENIPWERKNYEKTLKLKIFLLIWGDPYPFWEGESLQEMGESVEKKTGEIPRCYVTHDLVNCLTEFQPLLYPSMSHWWAWDIRGWWLTLSSKIVDCSNNILWVDWKIQRQIQDTS